MGRVVRRAYRYRCYLTPEQAGQLARTFGLLRYVYNRALAERSRAWSQEQRRVTYAETNKMLTGWKRGPDTCWLADPSKGPLQAALRNLHTAYVNFWAKRAKYPTFKKKGKSTDSATYFQGCFTFRDGKVTLAKQGRPLDVVWSRPLPEGADPSQVTVSRNARGQCHVSILVETTVHEALWYGRTVIAVDRWFPSSKTCSACGVVVDSLPLNIREWTCPGCGVTHDRDINAAINILAAGLVASACGDGVRPPRS